MSSLPVRSALVAGASRGIGRAIALALAGEGAALCLVGRERDTLEKVAAEAGSRSGGSHPLVHPADLTNDGDVRDLAARVERELHGLDVLVHSHGSYLRGPAGSVPAADFDALYRSNVRSAYVLTQSLLPLLKASRGQIVFVNSSIVGSNQPELGHYAATQQALRAFADSLRQEVNPDGIRVLSIYPGRTATPRQASIHALEGKPYRPETLIQPEDVAAMVISALRLPRTAEVTDIHIRPMVKPA